MSKQIKILWLLWRHRKPRYQGARTNVFKLYEAVDIQGHKFEHSTPQVAFYDDVWNIDTG